MSGLNGSRPAGNEEPSVNFGDESFEDMLGALEAVVGELEEGNLSLGATIATFEQGMSLARRCQALLAQAELRISQIETDHDSDAEGSEGEPQNQQGHEFSDVPF